MKLPNKIATITELVHWVEDKKPKLIEIGKESGIREIAEFNPDVYLENKGNPWAWKVFRDIPIKYV